MDEKTLMKMQEILDLIDIYDRLEAFTTKYGEDYVTLAFVDGRVQGNTDPDDPYCIDLMRREDGSVDFYKDGTFFPIRKAKKVTA